MKTHTFENALVWTGPQATFKQICINISEFLTFVCCLHKLVALSSVVYFTFGLATSLIYSFTVISLSLSLLLGLFGGTHISSLNLTFAALSLTFIRGHKPFLVFRVDREIIGLPNGQGQLSRIWKVQCDWLSLGKQCCSGLSRRL